MTDAAGTAPDLTAGSSDSSPPQPGPPASGTAAGGATGNETLPGGESGTENGPLASAGSGGTSAGGTGGQLSAGGNRNAVPDEDRPSRVLLYSFSTLDIPSVPTQLAILRERLESWQYEVDESVDPADFTDDNLARYAAVGMINTCFSPFGVNNSGEAESEALQRFLWDGGGLFGTHCADVTFQSASPPALYNQLLGGRASSQNFEGANACRKVEDHPTSAALPETFNYVGNLDGTDFIADDSVILVRCTWGDANGTDVAVSWIRNEGMGRVFFTNFGKVDIDLTDPTIGDAHIIAGLEWVLRR